MNPLVESLLSWYQENKRDLPWRRDRDPYHIWVSEIMLQQTRVDTVIPYYLRFLEALPDIASLANAPEEKLLKLWEGLGYYSRVRNMQKAARQIIEHFNGQFPQERDELLSLSGIGPYASGSIGSIAFGRPYPAVDGNVLRVLARLLNDDTDIATTKARKKAEQIVVTWMPKDQCGDFTQAMMELGACICLPNGEPKCEACPVRSFCEAYNTNRVMDLPVKSNAKPRKIEEKTMLVVQCGNQFALRKRPSKGLLAGMWELIWLSGHYSADDLLARFHHDLTEPPKSLGNARHIFSHIEWHMSGYVLTVYSNELFPDAEWFTAEEIKNRLSVPTAFSAYIDYIISKQEG